jgi:hypothetical protein
VSSAAAERGLYAMTYWLKDGDPVRAASVVAGMTASVLAEARDVYQTPGVPETLYSLPESELQARMIGLAGKSRVPLCLERKTLTDTDVTVETGSDLGEFSGYLATFARDAGGDTITPQALQQTVADFQAGRRRWQITDTHSDSAIDAVAEVVDAQLDSIGLRITAKWLSNDRAQALRQMVLDGARLGLSIDYTAKAQPDGAGGRLLTQVEVYGGAITNKPMNGQAVIVEGKDALRGTVALAAPIVELYQDLQNRRADPDADLRRRMAEVVNASWCSPELVNSIGIKAAYDLVMDAARSSAARQVPRDPERERWEAANRYSSDLAEWMRANR